MKVVELKADLWITWLPEPGFYANTDILVLPKSGTAERKRKTKMDRRRLTKTETFL